MQNTALNQRPPAVPADNFPLSFLDLARALGKSLRQTQRYEKSYRAKLIAHGVMLPLAQKRFSAHAAAWLCARLAEASATRRRSNAQPNKKGGAK